MLKETCGRIGAVFLKGFHIAPAGVFINGGILIKLLSFCFIDQTTGRNEFHIDLDPLPGIFHLLIRLGDILGIGEFFRHDPLFLKEAAEAWNGAFISALPELHPENDQAGMRVAPAHIPDELDFLGSMLVGMEVGTPGMVSQRIPGAIIAVFPAINILAVGFIFNGSLGNAIFFSVANEG